jgi:ribonucleoside-diphosphate reductase alpha chain
VRLSENARTVLERRYLMKDGGRPIETPEDMIRRVAKNISSVEVKYGKTPEELQTTEEEFYRLMDELKFMPNSPTLMNAGRDLQQLAACFVLPIDDSMESIFETLKTAALIHKSGGGTGFSFSRLRPKNDNVGSTGGVASGPISFLKVYNASTEAVKQGGTRRGANMGILQVDHPDILEFIDAKKGTGEITNFNLSVAVTDAFMEAVAKGEEYLLINPKNGSPTGRLNAREVFDRIIKSAWSSGEPGIIFIDRMNEANPTPQLGAIESTNPCVTADTWITTSIGPRQVRELIGKPFEAIIDGQPYHTSEEGFFLTGKKSVIKLITKQGFSLRLTANHPVRRVTKETCDQQETEWTPAGELNPGDKVLLHNHRTFSEWPGKLTEGEGYLLGLLIGDEALKEDNTILPVWMEKEAVNSEVHSPQKVAMMKTALKYTMDLPHRKDFKGLTTVSDRTEYRLRSASLKKLADSLGMAPGHKTTTRDLEQISSEAYQGFLRSLFDCDGSVQGSQTKGVSVLLAQSDLDLLHTVQRMLLRLGIYSTIYENRRLASLRLLPDGKGCRKEYHTKPQYELVITGESIITFNQRIGFTHTRKANRLDELLHAYNHQLNREWFVATVSELVEEQAEDVYDLSVPGINAFDANGFYVHNCGEQPLLPYEACNLGSINLSLLVKDGQIDWDEFRRVVHLSIQFLDDVIDATRYPIKKIDEIVKGNRKVGLGVMGWAEMLILMNIPYNSEEATNLARQVMSFIDTESKEASVKLAKERGAFPNYKGSIYDRPVQLQLRNATTTTIAPTGTISIISDTSGGIEPLFSIAFTRQILDNDRLIEVNPIFERIAKERGFYSKELVASIADRGSIEGFEEIPEDIKKIFVTSHQISPEWHIRMQAAFQEHTDNAVSKTVNFPREATAKEVEEVYHLAFELGCKGVTVYRDGSIENQPMQKGLDNKEKQDDRQPSQELHLSSEFSHSVGEWGRIRPIHRPNRLTGITDGKTTPEGNLYLTLNLHQSHPFELFAQIGKAGSDVSAFTEAIARLISLAFRCGIDPEAVAEELVGIGGSRSVGFGPQRVRSVPDAIGQFLFEYLNNPIQVEHSATAEQEPLSFKEDGSTVVAADHYNASSSKNSTENGNSNGNGKKGKVRFNLCPVCGMYAFGNFEGCAKCLACGHSEC